MVSAKTVPRPLAPPATVVSYRVLPEMVSLEVGAAPLVRLNVAKTVGVPPGAGTVKTVAAVTAEQGLHRRPVQSITPKD